MAGERALRESGLNYSVVRPGSLKDAPPDPKSPPPLSLSSGANLPDHPVGEHRAPPHYFNT
eukprot:1180539-Prorocentrum_minimum.AAC.1